MNARIPSLDIALNNDGLIELEQQNGLDEPDRIQIHPLHLRYMAESLGLVRGMSAPEADALRMVDKLARRLRVLHGRIEQLQKWLAGAPDMENADINTEYWFNAATLNLANEFVREVDESHAVVTPRPAGRDATAAEPSANPDETQRVTAPDQMRLVA